MNYKIIRADVNDAEKILKLQKLAYQIEADRYNNYDIPPLKQTISAIKEQFKNHIFLKAVSEDKLIGSVRAHEKDGTCYVGKLAVHPYMQNQGIATALMKAIETYYKPKRFELFVGSKSDNNIHLYQKLGYTTYKIDTYESSDIEILYMEKVCKV
jgi:ribosomal protein S18 acetylase RimI-like enzyme